MTAGIAFKYTNRRGDEYFLHARKTKTGKDRFYVALKSDGTLLDEVPPGYEIYENPNARAVLRKQLVSLLTDEEIQTVHDGMAKFSHLKDYEYKLDLRKKEITIYEFVDQFRDLMMVLAPHLAEDENARRQYAHRYGRFEALLRFTLVDEKKRVFQAERFCFLGSIDDWILIGRAGPIGWLVAEFVKHLGQESFFELM